MAAKHLQPLLQRPAPSAAADQSGTGSGRVPTADVVRMAANLRQFIQAYNA
ncbi:MAG: hypothetical protein K8L97_01610 [Anaerolineae bacterium]|nr:hypothetical protein [Anaerolineae bacterium]